MPSFKKSLSQNLLVENSYIQKIIQTLAIEKNEPILEIGPGQGALSAKIIQQTSHYQAIEKDRAFIQLLKQQYPSIHWIEQDVLKVCFEELVKTPVKLVSNVPYNITKPLLKKICTSRKCFSSIFFLLQKEVVDKLLNPFPSSYTISLVQAFFSIEKKFDIPPQAFIPKAKVISTFIQLIPHQNSSNELSSFLLLCFSKKRKFLSSVLSEKYPKERILKAFETIGLAKDCRCESLTISQFKDLFDQIEKRR